ncbi:MAG: glycosyltransferase family 2 protein, partial [Planctomycetota bacterium]|nr:glycosyltransferase family 2 protein [Planctomycetota bacterium]
MEEANGPQVCLDDVHAVIANWNGGEDNLTCLASLVAAGLAEENIIFVDNGSTDGSLERVQAVHPGLRLIKNGENRGFGEAANQGAGLALELGAREVFFVNNDVELLPGALVALVDELRREAQLGIVGPRILWRSDPKRLWCAGGMLTWRQNLSTLLGFNQADGPAWRARRKVDYVAGCAMLVERRVFDQVGFFDATYFAYTEDVDLCMRARWQGFDVICLGEVAVLHESSSSTGGGYNPRRKYMMGLNSVRFLKNHGNASHW